MSVHCDERLAHVFRPRYVPPQRKQRSSQSCSSGPQGGGGPSCGAVLMSTVTRPSIIEMRSIRMLGTVRGSVAGRSLMALPFVILSTCHPYPRSIGRLFFMEVRRWRFPGSLQGRDGPIAGTRELRATPVRHPPTTRFVAMRIVTAARCRLGVRGVVLGPRSVRVASRGIRRLGGGAVSGEWRSAVVLVTHRSVLLGDALIGWAGEAGENFSCPLAVGLLPVRPLLML